MVHTIRKRNFHGNAIVYGVVTNGYSFTFLRVDNESRVSPNRTLQEVSIIFGGLGELIFVQWAKWNSPDDWNDHTSSRIYTLLRLIIRNAASTSPRSSPSKVKKGLKDTIATSDPARYHIQIGSSSSEGRMGVTSPSS